MSEATIQKIKETLKQQLKLKKVNYEELAEHLQCSVPTVKRFLGGEELSLSRLLSILQFLDLNLSELEMLSQEGKVESHKFTPEQEEFLVKNPHFLSYFLNLMSGETPKQIAEKFKLNQRSTDKYLIGLERMELIKVTGKLKVKPTISDIPVTGHGPLARKYFESIVNSATNLFLKMIQDDIFAMDGSDKAKNKKIYAFYTASVSRETYERYLEEQHKSEAEFLKIAKYEEKTRPKGELQVAVMLRGASHVPSDYKGLDGINNIFGPVIAL